MGSGLNLKDFMRLEVLKTDHGWEDRRELMKKKSIEVNNVLQKRQESSVRSVAKAPPIPQTTIYRIGTER